MTRGPTVLLLGRVALRHHDGRVLTPARLDRVVLAHLALAGGRALPAGDLLEAVWGPAPPATARNALQVKVSRLRRLLGEDSASLQHLGGGYRLALPAEAVDAHLVRQLAGDAADALAAGETELAAQTARRALDLWQGVPLADLDEHPRLVAARAELSELQAVLSEVLAESLLATPAGSVEAVAGLRALLAEQPMRVRARLLLMRALDGAGRRAEALAVYDVGRRVLAEQAGLAPPLELQQEFERLLRAERAAARREPLHTQERRAPAGAMDTARWLAGEGSTDAALELALRGSWWWWLGGRRSAGRDLLEELVGLSGTDGTDGSRVLGATAWRSVFESVGHGAAQAIATGERSLHDSHDLGWSRHQSVAAVLLAERLYQRGEPGRADRLLHASAVHFERAGDRWGMALVRLAAAKGRLQRGAVGSSARMVRAAHREFGELSDAAGQMMTLDHLGYCSEVVGDLATAARLHERALELARRVGAPEWEATQLTRLGSVTALLGDASAVETLGSAVALARAVGSAAGVALAENALGLARGLLGAHDLAADIHAGALGWYERQHSPAGMSYTAGRLAVELAEAEPEQASELAQRAVDLATATGDPRAVAHGLEALASTHPDVTVRARSLGGARALRRRSRAPLPSTVAATLELVERDLEDRLGAGLRSQLRLGALAVGAAGGPAGEDGSEVSAEQDGAEVSAGEDAVETTKRAPATTGRWSPPTSGWS